MKNYTKKPITIQAIQYNGYNIHEIIEFTGVNNIVDDGVMGYSIKTLEGNMLISNGDYVIKGVKGEFYPCKEDIFNMTYDENDAQLKKIEITTDGISINIRTTDLKYYEQIGLLRYVLVASEERAIKNSTEKYGD